VSDHLYHQGLSANRKLLEENARLKAEVERLTKAGDEMAKEMGLETYSDEHFKQQEKLLNAWNAAKEGKGQP